MHDWRGGGSQESKYSRLTGFEACVIKGGGVERPGDCKALIPRSGRGGGDYKISFITFL